MRRALLLLPFVLAACTAAVPGASLATTPLGRFAHGLTGYNPSPTPTASSATSNVTATLPPSPSPSAASSSAPTPTLAPTATPTPTPAPTPTPTPAPTPTPTPVAQVYRLAQEGSAQSYFFKQPHGIVVDAARQLYVTEDPGDVKIVKPQGAPYGFYDTFPFAGGTNAGFTDAASSDAAFMGPMGLALVGGTLYVADSGNNTIRQIVNDQVTTTAGSTESGFVDGPVATARFSSPMGVAADGAGTIYVADTLNHCIRKIAGGQVSTLAGDGTPGNGWRLNHPSGLALAPDGTLVVADSENHRIVRVGLDGTVTPLAGDGTAGLVDGPGAQARFRYPRSVAVDSTGSVYVADTENHALRMIGLDGRVQTLAGNGTSGTDGGNAPDSRFAYPWGVAVDMRGVVYVTDTSNNQVRIYVPVSFSP